MRKAITSFAAAALVALVVGVPAAIADKPTFEPQPAEDFTIDSSICGFPVSVEILTNNTKAITFSNGMTIVNGALSVRLTNVDDPTQTIVLNIPGPGFFDESGLIATGPWLFFFSPGELGPGSPGILAFTVGRVQISESGFQLLAGTQVNLCEQLSG
jgi:hypothetical protein